MVAEITALVLAYRYVAILAISLFEAPLMSIVIGFFVGTGHLNLYFAFGLVVVGDFIGDTVLYVFGRWFRPLLERIGFHLNLSPERVGMVLAYFEERDRRAIVISKLVHGIGFTGLIVAGSVRVPYRRFIVTCIVVTVSQSAVLAVVGLLSGRAYQSYAHILGYLDIVVAVIGLLVLFFLYRKLVAKIGERDTKE